MEGVIRLPQSGRIRSFFIKDILEHKRSSAEPPKSPPKGSFVVDQGAHTISSPRPYSVQRILETNGQRAEVADAYTSGFCECSPVYTYKTVTTPFYHPYLDSLYRQQATWRHSLKDGVSYVDPQNAMYSQSRQRKPRRPWTRAVFSNLQRKGLEKRFQVQKYLTKGDRHQLASMLGLSDNQVKVWFQNRRMKWRQEEQTQSQEESESEKKKDTQATVVSSNADTARKE